MRTTKWQLFRFITIFLAHKPPFFDTSYYCYFLLSRLDCINRWLLIRIDIIVVYNLCW